MRSEIQISVYMFVQVLEKVWIYTCVFTSDGQWADRGTFMYHVEVTTGRRHPHRMAPCFLER